MKGDSQVISYLNEILVCELTAINQYFLHARMYRNWGYHRLAEKVYQESLEEMNHAQELADRILFLEGLPNFQKLNKLNIGENAKEALEGDLKLELHALPILKKAIEHCYKVSDHTSRELFEKILRQEEDHVDWIEAQLSIIKEIGYANYLSQQLHGTNNTAP